MRHITWCHMVCRCLRRAVCETVDVISPLHSPPIRSALSDDDRLPGVVNSERLRPILSCDGQSVTVRELESENTFGWIIELFNGLLQ